MKEYRDQGAIGALLDEYEKSIHELIIVIKDISTSDLSKIVDHETADEDCRSIQTILAHVVGAGYTYIIEIRKSLGEQIDYREKQLLPEASEYIDGLHKMFSYSEQLFLDYPDLQLEEYDPNKKMKVRWGQHYDVEQIIEHAIVHILRHRRQIERFLLRL